MKIARLSSTQYRFWRSNQQFLVDENGVDIIRPATLAEAQAARPVVVQVPVLDQDGQPKRNNDGSELREDKVFELKTSRDLLKQDMLTQYGECIVTAHGNRRLAVVRDPDIIRAGPEQKNSPPPINCNCRDWGDPHPGRHHPACQWNSVAAPHERATKADQVKTMPAGFVASPIPGHMVPGQSSPELSPSECSCRQWKIGPEGWKAGVDHHPDCQYSLMFVSHAQEAREKKNHPAVIRKADEARVSGTPTASDAERKEPVSKTHQLTLAEQAMGMVVAPPTPLAPGSGLSTAGVPNAGVVGPTATRVVPGPENCVCRGFVPEGLSPDGQHKPICEFYEDYKRAHPEARGRPERVSVLSSTEPERPMIVDLENSKPLRAATLEEEEQALIRLKATGFPLVIVDGHQYGVLFPKGADVPSEWKGDDDAMKVTGSVEEAMPTPTSKTGSSNGSPMPISRQVQKPKARKKPAKKKTKRRQART